jgi:ketosteroid isomerase-like protein
MRRWRAVVLPMCLCASLALAQNQKAEEAMKQADREFAKAYAAADVEKFVSMIADDARFTQADNWITKEQVRKSWGDAMQKHALSLTWEPQFAVASRDGTMGYTTGRYEARTAEKTTRGIYLTVWRKGKDGQWRAVADIGSPQP